MDAGGSEIQGLQGHPQLRSKIEWGQPGLDPKSPFYMCDNSLEQVVLCLSLLTTKLGRLSGIPIGLVGSGKVSCKGPGDKYAKR